jgi:dTDP-4-dehydrorhamnose 3,5-epimerase
MNVIDTKFADVKIIEPDIFADSRGFFMESYNQKELDRLLGRSIVFVQDNQSRSTKGVLRGLHYQAAPKEQAKLVRVVQGEVLDVVVDIRAASPSFGEWFSIILSAENRRQLWIPAGFAHGFYVLSDTADYTYKTTEYYSPAHERSIVWNDSSLAIDWQLHNTPLVSGKDAIAPAFPFAKNL